MSLIVKKDEITKKEEAKLLKDSKVRELKTQYKLYPKTHRLYVETAQEYIFPRTIGIEGKSWRKMYGTPKYKIKFNYDKIPYTGNYGDHPDEKGEDRNQEEVVQEGVKRLKENGHVFYHFSTGYGKTSCGLETIRRLGRVTLWVVFNVLVQEQTYKEIKNFTDAKVEWYKTKKEPSDDAQIVIVGLRKASGLTAKFLSRFQTVVLDEVDQTPAKTFFPLFPKICPDYLLGLSATTKKSNGLDKTLTKYFGPTKDFIYRFIEKPDVTVIKLQTTFSPNIEMIENVKLGTTQVDNHEVNRSLAENNERNRMLLKSIREKSIDGQCLVLSPRKENIKWFYDKLKKKGYDVDYKTTGKKDIDKSKRILIAGLQGAGRGFDCKAKYLYILGVPPKIQQIIGRLRDPHGFVYIVVDNYSKFEYDWTKKCMPYIRKLNCKIQFQNELEEPQDYVVQKVQKEISIIDQYMNK
jgi:hypothetical protein